MPDACLIKHSAEYVRLIASILKGMVLERAPAQEARRHSTHRGLCPAEPSKPHVVGLDAQRAMAEGIPV